MPARGIAHRSSRKETDISALTSGVWERAEEWSGGCWPFRSGPPHLWRPA